MKYSKTRTVSVCRVNAEGKKTFLANAKINSVYYCENILEQGLLPAVCRISNNDFMFKQDGAPCMPFTTLSLTCIPMCLSSLNQKTGRRTVQI